MMSTGAPGRTFQVADYCVFALSLLLSVAIGLYHAFRGGRSKTTGEYFMGSRQLSILPVSISMLVSLVSANTLLGTPAEMYSFGITFWLLPIGVIPATFLVSLTFIPLFYPLNITSCYEYLELRFRSTLPKRLGSVLLIIMQMLYMGTVLYAPAIALEAVTALPAYSSIILVGITATVYTALGGMKAVIWADVFQSIIMVGGMLAIVIKGSMKVGGMGKVFEINAADQRIDFSDFFTFDINKRFTFWSLFVGYCIYFFGFYGTNQIISQRFCSLPSVPKAQISMLLTAPWYVIIQTLSALAGIIAYAYFAQKGCDPLSSGEITSSNQVLPFFVMEVLGYPGFPGLMLACIFSGSLSTVSSSLNSMTACVWEDFLLSRLGHISQFRISVLMIIMVFIFGVLSVGVAFLVAQIGGTMIQVASSFISIAMGPMAGMFTLGACFTFTNVWGAFFGTIIGFALPFWMMCGSMSLGLQKSRLPGRTETCFLPINATLQNNISITSFNTSILSARFSAEEISTNTTHVVLEGIEKFYSVAFAWYALIGSFTTVISGCIISVATGGFKEPVGKELLFPGLIRKYFAQERLVRGAKYTSVHKADTEMDDLGEYDEDITCKNEKGKYPLAGSL